jgi:hypothetical protein
MSHYMYNDEFQTLQQFNEHGVLIASMQMPFEDLSKISFLDWYLMVDKKILPQYLDKGDNTVV